AVGDSANLAKVRNNLGLVATDLGRYEEAREGFMSARLAARDLDEPLIEGRSLINLAMLALEVGDPLEALDHLAEARPLLAEADDAVGEQVLLGHVGAAYSAAGDPGRAIATLDSALQLARANGLRQEEAINLEQMADIHREAGNHRRALTLLAAAGRIHEELGLEDERAHDLRLEARIHAAIGNRSLARRKAEEGLAIHLATGSTLEALADAVLLAELSAEVGAATEARSRLAEVDRLAAELGTRSARVEAALGRARVADRLEDPGEVLESVASLEGDLDRVGYGPLWEADALRARALARSGRLTEAAAAGARAIEAVERVRESFGSGELRSAFRGGREEVYAGQVDLLLRLDRVEEAFATADAARGRALIEHATQARSEGGISLPPSFAEGERLLWTINELGERLDEIDEAARADPSPDLSGQAERIALALESARAEYAAARTRAAEHGRWIPGTRPRLIVRDVAGALRPGEALLEYLVAPDRVILFVARADTLRAIVRALARDDLSVQLRVARELVGRADGDPRRADAVLRHLHDLLIEPAMESGALHGVRRLIVVPHAELAYLPFGALLDRESGRYLAEEFVLVHVPSAASVRLLRGSAGRRRPRGGAVALAPFPDRLPATAVEIEALGNALPGARRLRGSQATERRLRQALEEAGIVHVATHGILNALNPMFSRIELIPGPSRRGDELPWTDDGRLEVHEVLGIRIASDLVFLSGCETGMGTVGATTFDRGGELATLAQAFLSSGAKSVIATLWRVEDRGAAIFATRFYRALESSAAPEALAAAQRAMIADPRWSSPYHWAAYRISGG
ncbi:MAG TPA: CHAT domain-containing tetratricopeptide repeat protein, partial [Longimicrobiaceae bacterium]|nr:CHAT domain-containing tetratricopeptide repeat protein [Longimicrobiaceae bacterium]